MCRPIKDLDKQVVLDETGRIGGYKSMLEQYDVLSAFPMSYRGLAASVRVPLAIALGDLPAFPKAKKWRLKRKGPCCWEPRNTRQQPTGYKPTEELTGGDATKSAPNIVATNDLAGSDAATAVATIPPQCEHTSAESTNLSLGSAATAALYDMAHLFQEHRNCDAVNVAYSMLASATREYIER